LDLAALQSSSYLAALFRTNVLRKVYNASLVLREFKPQAADIIELSGSSTATEVVEAV
jgi:hypothetical protein